VRRRPEEGRSVAGVASVARHPSAAQGDRILRPPGGAVLIEIAIVLKQFPTEIVSS